MNKPASRIIILILVCLFPAIGGQPSVAAQDLPPQYVHEAWTTERGLPQNTVSAILQTRDGYLWVGTYGGLARFDGVKFTVFDTGNAPGLQSNRILALCEDRAGNLWIGTDQGGLSRYFEGRFSTYTTRDGLPDNFVGGLAEDNEGGLWIGTSKGLARLKDGRFTTYTTQDGLADHRIWMVKAGRDGGMWIIFPRGLARWRAGRFETYLFPAEVKVGFEGPMSGGEGRDGSLWIASTWGLTRFRGGDFTFFPRQPRPSRRQRVAVVESRTGDIALLMPAKPPELVGEQVITEPRMMRLDHLQCLLEDREGNLWIGTGGDGLHRFRPAQVTAYDAEQGLLAESCTAITGDGADGLWLGSGIIFHFSQGRFTEYPGPRESWTVLPDRQGGLWFGNYQGLHYAKDGRLTHYPFDQVFTGAPVAAIYKDRAGQLWIGAGSDAKVGGLYRFQDGRFIRYGALEGCALTDVRNITEDRSGALWLGGVSGMSRFRDGKFTNYTTAQGLSHNYVRDIHEDADGTFWIGTYGGGLNRFKDGRFTPITTRHGLYDNIVSRILEDDHGNLWMSCNRGIYRASRRELNDVADGRSGSIACITYTVADGMKSNETNGGFQSAGYKAPDGRFWFPTVKGVVAIDPNKLNSLPPPVAIERVLVGQTSVDPTRPVEVRPGGGELEIHYTGLSLTAPEKARFKYKLDGYDQHWVEVGTRRIAYYTNTAPGRYTFRVMASNNDGVWSTQDATLQIVVIPPFWRTWWFLSGILFAVTGLAVHGYRYRIRQLEQRQTAQAAFAKQLIGAHESERKRIAVELHDSLGQSLIIIKNRALMSLTTPENPQRLLTQMEEISEAATQAINEVREIAHNLRPYQLDRMGLATALTAMLQAVAGASGIRFTAQIEPLDGVLSKDAEIGLYRIVQEALNNIVKHSRATEATITLKQNAHTVRLSIRDNGQGFALSTVETAGRRGLGLTSIAERAKMLGAKCEIRSLPNQGTTIIVELELPEVGR